jgi:VanZ family protein
MSRRLAALPRLVRAAAWLSVGALVWLSWIPRDWEARTSLPGQVEHAVAYAGTAGLFVLGYGAGLRWWRIGVPLVVLGAIMEVGQLWVPGRTAQVIDFLASGSGALVGAACGTAIVRLLRAQAPPSR